MSNKTNNHNNKDPNGNNAGGNNNPELLKSLGEFFKRELLSIPVVKKYPHQVIQQRCGLKAATLELDTAAYPNLEYVAGTRLSVYPANPGNQVQVIMNHLVDDIGRPGAHRDHIALPPNSDWWARFVAHNKGDSLRLALIHLFDITIAPTRDVIKLVVENCLHETTNQEKEARERFIAISSSNEAWEKWICSGHRTIRSLFEEVDEASAGKRQQKLAATRLLNQLDPQTPRQYSISNIKSSKRFRTEIIVFQHKFNLRQIELNLRHLKERETFDKSVSSPKSPKSPKSALTTGPPLRAGLLSSSSPVALAPVGQRQAARRNSGSPANRTPVRQAGAESSFRSGRSASVRSIRSLAPFATSPPISTHQVKRVPSFSGPLMSAYATASAAGGAPAASSSAPASALASGSNRAAISGPSSRHERMRSKMSLLSAPDANFSDPATSSERVAAHTRPGAVPTALFDGLCSNYLLNLNTNDQIICEFVENPRFTLKGNRERPIMMIGQDVGLIAFRPFWQQRHLEHDRAQVFYTLFKDLSPKKFGEMHLVCVTGHKCRIEELLFKREINLALTSRILSSVTYINRKHLVGVLSAAHTKSQLIFAQYSSTAASSAAASAISQQSQQQQQSSLNTSHLQITNKELLELGDRIHRLLVECTGCLYTCCDPHMTQAIEILAFESIARNSSQLTRERIMQLLPKWKGKDTSAGGRVAPAPAPARSQERSRSSRRPQSQADAGSIYTLENTYERARIVQEIYDNSI